MPVCVSIHPVPVVVKRDGQRADGRPQLFFFSLLGRKREARGNERGERPGLERDRYRRARSQQPHRTGTALPGQRVDGEREGRDRDWERKSASRPTSWSPFALSWKTLPSLGRVITEGSEQCHCWFWCCGGGGGCGCHRCCHRIEDDAVEDRGASERRKRPQVVPTYLFVSGNTGGCALIGLVARDRLTHSRR